MMVGLNPPPAKIVRSYFEIKRKMVTKFTIAEKNYEQMNLHVANPTQWCAGAAELVWEKLTQDPR